MRVNPGLPQEPRSREAARADRVSEAGAVAAHRGVSTTDSVTVGGLSRALARSQVLLQGLLRLRDGLADGAPDAAAVVRATRFDGETLLEPYLPELRRIEAGRDIDALNGLIETVENNVNALLPEGSASYLEPGGTGHDALLRSVVNALAQSGASLTRVQPERVADLLG